MFCAMVQCLCQPKAQRRRPPESISRVDLQDIDVRISPIGEERSPAFAMFLNVCREVLQVHQLGIAKRRALASHHEEIEALTSDQMTERREDRAIRPRPRGVELLRTEPAAGVNNLERRPRVMRKGVSTG